MLGARPAERAAQRLILLVILGISLWRLAVAATLPVTQDEAYYYQWAGALAWGYFDHPPGVALLGVGTQLAPGSVLAARIGALLASTLTLFVLWSLYRRCGLDTGQQALTLALAGGSIPGLVSGIVTTPDSVLGLAWALALREAAVALTPNANGERPQRRWLLAGAATGLGLLGKYTMVLIGPVFLWALLRSDPRALRSPWPYLGGIIAMLVFLPHILWNADNEWLTMRFQVGHGFSTETHAAAVPMATDRLPAPTGPMAYVPPQRGPLDVADRLESVGGYLGSQLLLWGLPLLPLLWYLLRPSGRAPVRRDESPDPEALSRQRATRPLLLAGALFPLLLFTAVSLISEVEPNWSAMFVTAAAPLLVLWLRPRGRPVLIAVAANLLLLWLYALHAATSVLPLPNATDRILRESHGFPELAIWITDRPGIFFADRYAYAAMLNFHLARLGSDKRLGQWPGIARPSEYNRGLIAPVPEQAALNRSGFWLVSFKFTAPAIAGFEPVQRWSIIDCPLQPLQIVPDGPKKEEMACQDWLHYWSVYRYRPTSADAATD